MLELDDFVTYKYQKPLTFREFVSVKKHNWKPCKTSHLLVSPLAAAEQPHPLSMKMETPTFSERTRDGRPNSDTGSRKHAKTVLALVFFEHFK